MTMKAIRIQKRRGSNQEFLARYCTFSTWENCWRDIYLNKKLAKKILQIVFKFEWSHTNSNANISKRASFEPVSNLTWQLLFQCFHIKISENALSLPETHKIEQQRNREVNMCLLRTYTYHFLVKISEMWVINFF